MTEAMYRTLNLVAFRNAHHMAGSGYVRMIDVLEGNIILTPKKMSLFERIAAKALLPISKKSKSRWYHRRELISELRAACRWVQGPNQIFHFLYGENSYRYLGYLKRLLPGNHIVCTYHLPPEKFETVVGDRKHFQYIDAVIVFSKEQVTYFSNLIDKKKVYHIPHGVDVNYFKPKAKPKFKTGTFKCLFVGQHLRDFSTLAGAAKYLETRVKNLRFSVVTSRDKHFYFKNINNVDLYHSIPDHELLSFYQDSDIFVLPLLKTTANCAIQEAMACGLPIVTTGLPAIKEYMDESCSFLTPVGDADGIAKAIQSLYQDDNLRCCMSQASRRKALCYRLEEIADKTKVVYRDIWKKNRNFVGKKAG